MASRRPAFIAAGLVGLTLGVGVPLGELWRACRAPASEACVWGKALLPVSLSVGAALGLPAALVAFLVVRAWQRRGRPGGDAG